MNKQDSLIYKIFNKQRILYNSTNVEMNLSSWRLRCTIRTSVEEYYAHTFKTLLKHYGYK